LQHAPIFKTYFFIPFSILNI